MTYDRHFALPRDHSERRQGEVAVDVVRSNVRIAAIVDSATNYLAGSLRHEMVLPPSSLGSTVPVACWLATGNFTRPFRNPIHAEVAMIFEEFDQFGKPFGRPRVRAGYCVDCLSGLYGEPVETVSEYLSDAEITSRQAHCGNCGEHKDVYVVLLPRGTGLRTR